MAFSAAEFDDDIDLLGPWLSDQTYSRSVDWGAIFTKEVLELPGGNAASERGLEEELYNYIYKYF